MLITGELNRRTWEIRRRAANHWNCKVLSVSWKHCLKLAKYHGTVEKIWQKEVLKQAQETTNKTIVYERSATKQTVKKRRGRPEKNGELIPFIENCISAGNMTRKQLLAATMLRYPEMKKSSLSVTISNCGNTEKTRLTGGKVFVKDENKHLVFA